MKKIMMYAGNVLLDNNKLGERFVDPKGKYNDIHCTRIKKSFYYIGVLVEIDEIDNSFKHKTLNKKCENEELIEKYRLKSIEAEQYRNEAQTAKKLKTESKKIDHMTIGEIKNYCQKSVVNRRLIRAYLMEKLG